MSVDSQFRGVAVDNVAIVAETVLPVTIPHVLYPGFASVSYKSKLSSTTIGQTDDRQTYYNVPPSLVADPLPLHPAH